MSSARADDDLDAVADAGAARLAARHLGVPGLELQRDDAAVGSDARASQMVL